MDDKHCHTDSCNHKNKDQLLRSIYNSLVRLNISQTNIIDLLKVISDSLDNFAGPLDDIAGSVEAILEALTNSTLSCNSDSVLACGEGIDGVNRSIRTDINNVLASLPSASTQSQIGRLFSTSTIVSINTIDNDATITIENPPNSGRIMYLDSVHGGSAINGPTPPGNDRLPISIFILKDPTPALAVQLDERNLNYGSAETSSMIATLSQASTGGDVVDQKLEVFGSYEFDYEGRIIIPPGHNLGVRVLGAFSVQISAIRVYLTVTWYELDIPT